MGSLYERDPTIGSFLETPISSDLTNSTMTFSPARGSKSPWQRRRSLCRRCPGALVGRWVCKGSLVPIYGRALRGPAPTPPPNGLGSPPPSGLGIPSPPLVWGLVGGNPPPSSLWCGVWWGRVPAGKSWWARGGREASLVRQTIIFCGRRFCSETLGCPFKCFGRPWRFLLGTIQYRAIKSVLMTSRPPILDYTLCHILYMIYS